MSSVTAISVPTQSAKPLTYHRSGSLGGLVEATYSEHQPSSEQSHFHALCTGTKFYGSNRSKAI